MNHDDDLVLGYLRKFPNAFVSAMEICKRAADRRRFASEPDWAKQVLIRLTQQHVLECNITGQYRIKPEEEEDPKKHGRPYVPRPEPSAPAAAEQAAEKPATAAATGDAAKSVEARSDPSARVGGHEPEAKKAA